MPKILLGNARHQLDDKNRTRIPAKFREGLSERLYLLPGKSGCLYIVSEEKFELVYESLGDLKLFRSGEEGDLQTFILGNSEELSEDAQGRIKIAQSFCNMANIIKDVVFVGKGNYLEVWAAETWDKQFSPLDPLNLKSMLERLKKFGV